jgi:hypothetical protein
MAERVALILPLLALAALLARPALAQDVEAEWRAVSDVSATLVPGYVTGSGNPFPMRTATTQNTKTVDEAAEEAARTKAEALARGRKLINSDKVFLPNVEGVDFNGYVAGKGGEEVLRDNKWMAVGEAVSVPVKGAAVAYKTIEDLRQIDREMADELAKELDSRLSSSPMIKLRIVKITPKDVTLTSGKDSYTVPVRQGGF